MNVLVACEESQRVTMELRKLGHSAYSCDILDCTGGHPEWHIKSDVLSLLSGNCRFKTMDGIDHEQCGAWDEIIAFPPCTHLAVSGAAWFAKKRADGRQREAIEFFMAMINADCPRIAVENPVNIISGHYITKWFPDLQEKYHLPLKPTQHIQPYEFGDHARKKTCLWLKGLPLLTPTNIVDMGDIDNTGHSSGASADHAVDENGKILAWNDPRTARIRSKTFPGVAEAMARQWSA